MLNAEERRMKWEEIKGGIRNLWGDIDPVALDRTEGNIPALAQLIRNETGESQDTIKDKMQLLVDSFDNETDRNNISTSSYMRSPLGPDQGASSDQAAGATDFQDETLHDRNYGMNGFSEARDDVGIDYDTARENKNVRDFDSDPNARH